MKKSVFLALLGLSLAACSNEDPAAETQTVTKSIEAPSISKTKPEASAIMARYGQNKTQLGYKEATAIFASECKEYLDANGHTTTGLNNDQIINLFITNF